MDKKVKALLDFQRFQQNRKLAGVIADAESRYAHALSDDDLELVSAASEADVPTFGVAPLLARHDMPEDEEREAW